MTERRSTTDETSASGDQSDLRRRAFLGAGATVAAGSLLATPASAAGSTLWGMVRGAPEGYVTCDGNSTDIYPSGYYSLSVSDGSHTFEVYNKNDALLYSESVSVSGDTRFDKTLDLVRGTWRRPPTDLSTMKSNIDTYFDYGVTDLYLDTFFHGSTIYPSAHTVKKSGYADSFLGDVISYAHSKGMRVHTKIDAHYWWNCQHLGQPPSGHPLDGSDAFASDDGNTYYIDGSRITKTKSGEWESEGGKNFASPFCSQNVTLLEDVATEIDDNYDVDGIQLDYIRFPKHDPAFGYGNCSPYDGTQTESEMHVKREDAVDNVVKNVSAKIDTWTIASVAVFPEYYMNPGPAEKNKSQDWSNWGHDYDVDWDCPMCYKYDAYDDQFQKSMNLQTWNETVMPGLAITGNHDDIDTQHSVYDNYNFAGYVVWNGEAIDQNLP